eukprot:7926538-Pyramimonas_sp.AAC.1
MRQWPRPRPPATGRRSGRRSARRGPTRRRRTPGKGHKRNNQDVNKRKAGHCPTKTSNGNT